MSSFLKDLLLPLLLVTLTVFGTIFGLSYLVESYNCSQYAAATGRETKFVGFSCYGLIDGVWYSEDEYSKIIVPQRLELGVSNEQ